MSALVHAATGIGLVCGLAAAAVLLVAGVAAVMMNGDGTEATMGTDKTDTFSWARVCRVLVQGHWISIRDVRVMEDDDGDEYLDAVHVGGADMRITIFADEIAAAEYAP